MYSFKTTISTPIKVNSETTPLHGMQHLLEEPILKEQKVRMSFFKLTKWSVVDSLHLPQSVGLPHHPRHSEKLNLLQSVIWLEIVIQSSSGFTKALISSKMASQSRVEKASISDSKVDFN